jgi:hypothetical protein
MFAQSGQNSRCGTNSEFALRVQTKATSCNVSADWLVMRSPHPGVEALFELPPFSVLASDHRPFLDLAATTVLDFSTTYSHLPSLAVELQT